MLNLAANATLTGLAHQLDNDLALCQLSTADVPTHALAVHLTALRSDLDNCQGQCHGYGEEDLLEGFHR